MKYPKPKVGDKVLALRRSRYSPDELVEQIVVRVGRVYFYTRSDPDKSWDERNHSLKDWFSVWPSREAHDEDQAAIALFKELSDGPFAPYGQNKFSFDQLRRIKAIVEEPSIPA